MASLVGTRREGGWLSLASVTLAPSCTQLPGRVDGIMQFALSGVFFKSGWASMAAQRIEAAILTVLIPRWLAMLASAAVCDVGIMTSSVSVFRWLDIFGDFGEG